MIKQLMVVPQIFVKPVWDYWREKRAKRNNMPLLRRFEVVVPVALHNYNSLQ